MISRINHVIPRGGHAMDSAAINYLANNKEALSKFGMNFDALQSNGGGYALDAGPAPVLPSNTGIPAQFLQQFLPGVVHIMTQNRSADKLAPIVNVGDWADEEIILRSLEHLGTPRLYADHSYPPITSWNDNNERRTIIRHELGVAITRFDQERNAKQGYDSAMEKRNANALAFEILRNDIFFNGFSFSGSKTYGMLNDPNLPAYVTVANGAGGFPEWSTKTVNERISDLLTAIIALRVQSGNIIDPMNQKLILAVSASVFDLMTESDSGNGYIHTVRKWLSENYPNIEPIAVNEFDGVNGGENVFYLYAENVTGSGTDDGNTIIQMTPQRMLALGTETKAKGTLEAYTAAHAGCLVKRGYAVVRYTDI